MRGRLPAEKIASLLRRVPLLSVLTEQELSELARRVVPRRFLARQPIFLQGDRGDEFFMIVEGTIRIAVEGRNGREVTLAHLEEGDVFGELSLLDDEPRSASAHAATPALALMLHRRDFHEFLDVSPDRPKKLLDFLAKRLRRANRIIHNLALLSVRQRLAALLAKLAREEGEEADGGVLLPSTYSQRELGAMLSTSRETVTRELKKFKDEGLVEQVGRRLRILDVEGLQARVDEEGG